MNRLKFNGKEVVEVLTLVAVVGGFLAVVQELRQTQSALDAQAYQTRALETINASWEVLAADDDLLNLVLDFESGRRETDALSPVERMRLTRWYHMRRSDTDNEHFQHEKGFLDDDFYETTTVRDIKANAPFWRALGVTEPRQSFREEVDRILADSSIVPTGRDD
jgi:hypothetical protein